MAIFTCEAFYCIYSFEPCFICNQKSVTSSLDTPVHIHLWSHLFYIFSWALYHLQSQVHWTPCPYSLVKPTIVNIVLNLVSFAVTKASQVHRTPLSIFTREAIYFIYSLEPCFICSHKFIGLPCPYLLVKPAIVNIVFQLHQKSFNQFIGFPVCIHLWSLKYCLEPW